MLRTRQLDLFACLTLLISGTVQGCASSAIGDLEVDDGPLASEENPSTSDGGSSADEDEEDDAPVVTKKDASVKDASVKDAAVDSGAKDAGTVADASAPKDASTVDASAPKDAGSTVADAGSSTPKDAGSDAGKPTTTPTPTGECSQDSDCKQSCVPIGLFQCCSNHQCGCTWAPGTYCF